MSLRGFYFPTPLIPILILTISLAVRIQMPKKVIFAASEQKPRELSYGSVTALSLFQGYSIS